MLSMGTCELLPGLHQQPPAQGGHNALEPDLPGKLLVALPGPQAAAVLSVGKYTLMSRLMQALHPGRQPATSMMRSKCCAVSLACAYREAEPQRVSQRELQSNQSRLQEAQQRMASSLQRQQQFLEALVRV